MYIFHNIILFHNIHIVSQYYFIHTNCVYIFHNILFFHNTLFHNNIHIKYCEIIMEQRVQLYLNFSEFLMFKGIHIILLRSLIVSAIFQKVVLFFHAIFRVLRRKWSKGNCSFERNQNSREGKFRQVCWTVITST